MKRKLFYLINPISGTKKKKPLKQNIIDATSNAGFDYEIMDTRADGDYSFLQHKIKEDHITDVIICGGDGSVSTVASYLLDIPVAIGIIPMGSGNGLALAAGIAVSTKKALDVIFKGKSAYIDGFSINNKFSCMMCGIGSDAQIAHEFATKEKRGLQTYLKLSASNYFKSKAFNFSISTHNKTFDTNAFFICVANSNQFGNHVTIAPRASLNDGLFDVVVVKKMHKLLLPFSLINQIAGNNKLQQMHNYRDNKNILYFQSEEITIINKSMAPIHIDGEPQPGEEKLIFKMIPNAFRLLQP
ncbi:MAG: YegS/Rv2252/BmrU family lipid kinase [Flavitalea sp.]